MTFYRIVTLGCRVNRCESEALAAEMDARGWRRVRADESADVVVVNSCTVTARAAMQSRQALRRVRRDHPGARVVATGCYAQTDPAALQATGAADLVVGQADKHRIVELLGASPGAPAAGAVMGDIRQCRRFGPLAPLGRDSRSRPVLKIQDGCDAFCTYCIVPHARGPSRSLPASDVLERLAEYGRRAAPEVVLSGIHLGRWGCDLTPRSSLAALLDAIDRAAPVHRLRLSSIEPCELTSDIVALLQRSGRFCDHVHIPLQSGDDGILQRMHRPYSAARFAERVRAVRRRLPRAAIGTDVLVGFPGESEAAFERTAALLDALPVTYLHVFPFSPRPGTPAQRFDHRVDAAVIRRRCARLRRLGAEKRNAFFLSQTGRTVEVLVERISGGSAPRLFGVSTNYIPVTARAPAGTGLQTCVPVRLTGPDGDRAMAGIVV